MGEIETTSDRELVYGEAEGQQQNMGGLKEIVESLERKIATNLNSQQKYAFRTSIECIEMHLRSAETLIFSLKFDQFDPFSQMT